MFITFSILSKPDQAYNNYPIAFQVSEIAPDLTKTWKPSKFYLCKRQWIYFLLNLDDGHYPKIKAYSEYGRDDVNKLVSQNNWEEVSKVISQIRPDTATGSSDFITFLAALIHDKNDELS